MMKQYSFTDCVEITGSSCEKYEGKKWYVSTGAVNVNHIEKANIEKVSYYEKPTRANLIVESGDILFAKMQGTKKTLLIDEKLAQHIYSTGFCSVRPKPQMLTKRCLYHLLTSKMFLNQKDKNCSGATQKAITNAGLEKILVRVPEVINQDAISDQLDKLALIINKYKEELNKLDELIKSKFVEMFGNPLQPAKSKPLGDMAMLERGKFSPRPRNDPQYYNGAYPFVQTGDVANCNHRLTLYHQTLNEKGIKVSKCFSSGTILIALVGATIGATAILEIDAYAPDSLIGITPKLDVCNNAFLEVLLRFWQPELKRIAPEAARANINLEILENIPIIDVDFTLQEDFAAFVQATDKLKFVVQKSLNKVQLLFDSLMQKYFG